MIWAFAAHLVVRGNVVDHLVQPSPPGADRAPVAWGAAPCAASALWHSFVVWVTLPRTNVAGSALAWLAGSAALLLGLHA